MRIVDVLTSLAHDSTLLSRQVVAPVRSFSTESDDLQNMWHKRPEQTATCDFFLHIPDGVWK